MNNTTVTSSFFNCLSISSLAFILLLSFVTDFVSTINYTAYCDSSTIARGEVFWRTRTRISLIIPLVNVVSVNCFTKKMAGEEIITNKTISRVFREATNARGWIDVRADQIRRELRQVSASLIRQLTYYKSFASTQNITAQTHAV